MKRLSLLASFLCTTVAAFAEIPVPREEAGKIKTYDLVELNANLPEVEGKLLKIKFTFRGDTAQKQEDGSLRSVIRFLGRSKESGVIAARVPKEATSWFLKLPYAATSRQTLIVYAKMNKDEGGMFAELLGRELRTDTKGPKIIW